MLGEIALGVLLGPSALSYLQLKPHVKTNFVLGDYFSCSCRHRNGSPR